MSPEDAEAYLGTDPRTYLADGETPQQVAAALVDQFGAIAGLTREETIAELAPYIDRTERAGV